MNREPDKVKNTDKAVRPEISKDDKASESITRKDQAPSTGVTSHREQPTNDKHESSSEINKDNTRPKDIVKKPADSVVINDSKHTSEDSVLPHSFYEMRPSRVSDVSDASSHDSSHSSTTSEYFQQEQRTVNNSNTSATRNKETIEILSSDEEDEDDGLPKAISSNTTNSNNKQLSEEFAQMNILDAASHERELKTLEFTLKQQQVRENLVRFCQ